MTSDATKPLLETSQSPRRTQVRGRWAPSPTGPVHLGNARTALAAWLSVRRQKGALVWRVEDLDQQRAIPGLADQQQQDLDWLGLDWDEGPNNTAGAMDQPGSHQPYEQSQRDAFYLDALQRLHEKDQLFPCQRSRREIQEIASAPHGPETSPYPRVLRPSHVESDWFEALLRQPTPDASIRYRVEPGTVEFTDLLLGHHTQNVSNAVGDFVLRRRDGAWAYQLAVVVDDIQMGITEVVRGADLLDSTARQILLFESLGAEPPSFAHLPLVVSTNGEKLNKRDEATSLASLRAAGVSADRIVGYLAWTLGLIEHNEALEATELLNQEQTQLRLPFWERISSGPTVIPIDVTQRLLARPDRPPGKS